MARSGDVRTRLTHSIEVENYGEWIAETLAARLVQRGSLPPDLRTRFVQTVGNACLLHDIGNPPFGHMGEYAIRKWFEENEEALVDHCTRLKNLTRLKRNVMYALTVILTGIHKDSGLLLVCNG